MRHSTLAAAAIAAGLTVAAPAKNAAAMQVATPGQLGLAEGAGALEKTVLVCGSLGLLLAAGLLGMVPPLSLPLSVLGMAPPLLVGMASSVVGVASPLATLVALPVSARRASAR